VSETDERRVALVTGGGRGIGRAIGLALAESGCDVVVAGRSLEPLEDVRAEIEERGVRAAAVQMDVTRKNSVETAMAEVAATLGDPTVVVNNAGIASASPFLGLSEQDWTRTFAVNVTGAFLVTRAALPGMLAAGFGRVVNLGSTAAVRGYPYTVHYTASKHALLGMTRALALEVATKGVTVNCVCPGFVDTEMTAESIANIMSSTGRSEADARTSLESQSPQRRLIQPGEVAAAVVHLCSDDARGVNGQAIVINGGG
jgi:3-hydroxybutyrate dehydrogenase